jgi:hypothetical protein
MCKLQVIAHLIPLGGTGSRYYQICRSPHRSAADALDSDRRGRENRQPIKYTQHRHVDLALGPRPRADQAGMAAADKD